MRHAPMTWVPSRTTRAWSLAQTSIEKADPSVHAELNSGSIVKISGSWGEIEVAPEVSVLMWYAISSPDQISPWTCSNASLSDAWTNCCRRARNFCRSSTLGIANLRNCLVDKGIKAWSRLLDGTYGSVCMSGGESSARARGTSSAVHGKVGETETWSWTDLALSEASPTNWLGQLSSGNTEAVSLGVRTDPLWPESHLLTSQVTWSPANDWPSQADEKKICTACIKGSLPMDLMACEARFSAWLWGTPCKLSSSAKDLIKAPVPPSPHTIGHRQTLVSYMAWTKEALKLVVKKSNVRTEWGSSSPRRMWAKNASAWAPQKLCEGSPWGTRWTTTSSNPRCRPIHRSLPSKMS